MFYQINASMIDWPGHVSTVFFIPGCNFKCKMCHNHELLNIKTCDYDFSILENKIIDGVVISGGEPFLNEKAVLDIIDKSIEKNLPIKIDTNGLVLGKEFFNSHISENMSKILNSVSAISMDIKAPVFSNIWTEVTTSSVDLRYIRAAVYSLIDWANENNKELEFRTTVVPDLTESTLLNPDFMSAFNISKIVEFLVVALHTASISKQFEMAYTIQKYKPETARVKQELPELDYDWIQGFVGKSYKNFKELWEPNGKINIRLI